MSAHTETGTDASNGTASANALRDVGVEPELGQVLGVGTARGANGVPARSAVMPTEQQGEDGTTVGARWSLPFPSDQRRPRRRLCMVVKAPAGSRRTPAYCSHGARSVTGYGCRRVGIWARQVPVILPRMISVGPIQLGYFVMP